MKRIIFFAGLLPVLCSCMENTIDATVDKESEPLTLESLMTRSGTSDYQIDTFAMKSVLQSDLDLIMLAQVIMKDGVFILSISRDDAASIGVSSDMYDDYCAYVDRLNSVDK